MEHKRILVIGGGICGILSIAQLKAEGFNPICYERSENYGGTWCYRKETMYGQASIMPTTVINHSKEMGALSDFPPNKEYPNYMQHSQLFQYVTEYSKSHECEKHILYRMQVLNVKRAEDYEKTGRWKVTTKNLTTGKVITETFDGVLVCTGHINMPSMPEFPGQGEFSGEILHTHSLKEVEEFTDKRVVIVGIGCSALDAAVSISRVAKQVYLSTRTGAFIWNRVGRKGYPIDYILLRRYLTFLLNYLPINLVSWYLQTFYLDTVYDHRNYYIKPKFNIMSRDPILNDHIIHKLLSGSVIQKGDIRKLTNNGAFFEDEETLTEIDAVIMATGYTWGYPFLDNGILEVDEGIIHLYKCMYPPQLRHPTLAFIGFINPYGGGFPLAEIQTRWASYLLAGKGDLPPKDVMMKDIIKRHKANERRYIPGERMSVRVDFVQYMDEISEQMGVRPRLFKYLITDFPLFIKLLFGPCVSYQYRLEGHGKWNGAREAIMTVEERLQWPLRKKPPYKQGIVRYILDYIINLIPVNVYIWR